VSCSYDEEDECVNQYEYQPLVNLEKIEIGTQMSMFDTVNITSGECAEFMVQKNHRSFQPRLKLFVKAGFHSEYSIIFSPFKHVYLNIAISFL
jgi:hypothetical protein